MNWFQKHLQSLPQEDKIEIMQRINSMIACVGMAIALGIIAGIFWLISLIIDLFT